MGSGQLGPIRISMVYPQAFGLSDFTGNLDTLRIGTRHIQDQDKFAVDHLSTGTFILHMLINVFLG